MKELKGKQNKFLLALLQNNTTEEAIESMEITRNTAYKYLSDPDFKQALRQARKELVMIVSQKLAIAGDDAVVTLREIVKDKGAPPSSRVSAARTMLEFLYRTYENDELLERIELLEEQIESRHLN